MSTDQLAQGGSPEPLPPESVDPWPHEPGEDPTHILDAAGHFWAHGDSQAQILSMKPVKPQAEKMRSFHLWRKH